MSLTCSRTAEESGSGVWGYGVDGDESGEMSRKQFIGALFRCQDKEFKFYSKYERNFSKNFE